MSATPSLTSAAAALRREFDAKFAALPVTAADGGEPLLAIRVARDHYALRLRDVRGLITARKIVPLPSRSSELLGIAGLRGGLVHVYSLAVLLGHPVDGGAARWWVLAGTDRAIAFAFHEFQGLLHVRLGDGQTASPRPTGSAHVGEIVPDTVRPRGLIRLSSLVDAIEGRDEVHRPAKE
jgi:chemotaxis signal transduction protein